MTLVNNNKISCLLLLIFAAATSTTAEDIQHRIISPEGEAQQIATDAADSLLADPKLVQKIIQDLKIIRAENPIIENVTNIGRKYLGRLRIEQFTNETFKKINESQFGPATAKLRQGKDGTVSAMMSFTKPYKPDVLSRELSKLGISADPIWIFGPDYGNINYNADKDTYTFREGYENCKPNCKANHFWIYKVTGVKSKLVSEYATDIPVTHSSTVPKIKKADKQLKPKRRMLKRAH